jgi:hypothetical protein
LGDDNWRYTRAIHLPEIEYKVDCSSEKGEEIQNDLEKIGMTVSGSKFQFQITGNKFQGIYGLKDLSLGG